MNANVRALRPHAPARAQSTAEDPNAWLVSGLILGTIVRILGQANLLQLFYGYGDQGGNPIMKISPGTYILMFVWLRSLRGTAPVQLQNFRFAVISITSIVVGGIAFALVSGQSVATGYLVDSYLVTSIGLTLLGKVDEKGRNKLMEAMVWALIANSLMLFAEYALKRRFIPAPLEAGGQFFRPAGLLNHPLMSGLMYATAIPLVMLLRRPLIVRSGIALLFALCVFASGARVSSVLAAGAFLASFGIALSRERPRTTLGQTWVVSQALAIIGIIPVVVLAAMASGIGERLALGFADKSASTRVWQFGMLQYLNTHQLMVGIGNQTAMDWSFRLFQTKSVESSIVLGIFMYGLPFTIFYHALVLLAVLYFAWRGDALIKLSVAVFAIASMTNNTLGAKNPAVFYFLMFVAAAVTNCVRRSAPAPVLRSVRPRDEWRRARTGSATWTNR